MGVSWVDPGGGASAGDGARAVVRETGFDHLRKLEEAHLARRRDGDGLLADEDDATGDLEGGEPVAQRGTQELLGGGGTERGHERRSEEHKSELQSLMRISYADSSLQTKTKR